jgi:hypothetical protein
MTPTLRTLMRPRRSLTLLAALLLTSLAPCRVDGVGEKAHRTSRPDRDVGTRACDLPAGHSSSWRAVCA